MYSPGEMEGCIEEWFANAYDIKEVCNTYITVITKAKEQYSLMLTERINEMQEK